MAAQRMVLLRGVSVHLQQPSMYPWLHTFSNTVAIRTTAPTTKISPPHLQQHELGPQKNLKTDKNNKCNVFYSVVKPSWLLTKGLKRPWSSFLLSAWMSAGHDVSVLPNNRVHWGNQEFDSCPQASETKLSSTPFKCQSFKLRSCRGKLSRTHLFVFFLLLYHLSVISVDSVVRATEAKFVHTRVLPWLKNFLSF